MIPVNPVGPPPGFMRDVVRPARAWVNAQGWDWDAPPPKDKASKLKTFWTLKNHDGVSCLDYLHESYAGVCAYLSVYFERVQRSTSVDHYHPKSHFPIKCAYDWANYRLASNAMNSNKGECQDVLDPFTLPTGLFQLDLVSGRVQINTQFAEPGGDLHQRAHATLQRLKLNQSPFCRLRLSYIDEYLRNRQLAGADALEKALNKLHFQSPFIYQEILRQGR